MNIYDSIPRLQGFLSNPNRHGIGTLGEMVAAKLLEKSGYTVSHTHVGQQRGDLRAVDQDGQVHHIEVKTARRGKDRKWRFLLYKKGCTNFKHADWLILLAVTASGDTVPFVIPVADLSKRSSIIISSNPRDYAGRWSAYRQRQDNLILGA